MKTVSLDPDDELRAAGIGFARMRNALERNYQTRHSNGSRWGGHIEGACAELAASIALDLPWTGASTPWGRGEARAEPTTLPDLGDRTEVRWVAPSKYEPCLYFAEATDHDDRFYVLVVGLAPTYVVYGSLLGIHCRELGERVQYPERVVFRVRASLLRPTRPT